MTVDTGQQICDFVSAMYAECWFSGAATQLFFTAASCENRQCGFRTGLTQTGLYSYRSKLEAKNFGRRCTIRVAKTKALISFAITAKLICAFVFAYVDCWFSHGEAHCMLFIFLQYTAITLTLPVDPT